MKSELTGTGGSTFEVKYDYLVYAVGVSTGDFGITEVQQYCDFIKDVKSVRKLKNKITTAFETAALPGLTEQDIRRILTFVVVGAGPTGIEFAGEFCDFVQDEVPRLYPRLTAFVSIQCISAG